MLTAAAMAAWSGARSFRIPCPMRRCRCDT